MEYVQKLLWETWETLTEGKKVGLPWIHIAGAIRPLTDAALNCRSSFIMIGDGSPLHCNSRLMLGPKTVNDRSGKLRVHSCGLEGKKATTYLKWSSVVFLRKILEENFRHKNFSSFWFRILNVSLWPAGWIKPPELGSCREDQGQKLKVVEGGEIPYKAIAWSDEVMARSKLASNLDHSF